MLQNTLVPLARSNAQRPQATVPILLQGDHSVSGGLEIKIDVTKLAAFAAHLHDAKSKLPKALAQAVMKIGPEATSQMKRVLPAQTGLKFKTINKALKGRGAGSVYTISSEGGDIRLKFFGARETAKGVTAAPWNSRRLYPATFIRSGWWPKRGKPVAGGQVMQRMGQSKYPIKGVRSGLFIPEEMVKGNSAVVFYGTVDAKLAPAVEAVLFAAL